LSVALDAAAFWVAPEARYGEMYRLQTRRVALVPHLRDVTEACDSLGSASWASYFAGHYQETIHFADECLKLADGVDAGNYEHALQWRLMARFSMGEWVAVLEDQALLESMVDEVDGSIPVFLGAAYAQVLLCHELRGERDQAQAYLGRLSALRAEIGEDMGLPRAPIALTLLHQGRIEDARDWLTLEDMSRSLGPILEAMCALAPEEGDDEAAWALAEIVRNDLKRMESPSLEGHADRLEGRLLAAAGNLDEAAMRFQRSAEGFAALGAPWEEALSRLLLGETQSRTPRKAETERELRRSLDTFDRLGSVAELDRATAALARL
jgi:tetratricopeptide (TPR) repeat protein